MFSSFLLQELHIKDWPPSSVLSRSKWMDGTQTYTVIVHERGNMRLSLFCGQIMGDWQPCLFSFGVS